MEHNMDRNGDHKVACVNSCGQSEKERVSKPEVWLEEGYLEVYLVEFRFV